MLINLKHNTEVHNILLAVMREPLHDYRSMRVIEGWMTRAFNLPFERYRNQESGMQKLWLAGYIACDRFLDAD